MLVQYSHEKQRGMDRRCGACSRRLRYDHGPDVKVDYDKTADLASYKTYGFPEEVGTDRAGYATLVTRYFKDAVNREMQRRGFVYDA